jgi:hypothetical protein
MDANAARLERPSVEREGDGDSMGLQAINAEDSTPTLHTVRRDARAAGAAAEVVTLIVYGWTAAEPGTLWWSFPSVAAALAAARAMKNAVMWAIVKGPPRGAIVDIATARAAGSVLIEQTH